MDSFIENVYARKKEKHSIHPLLCMLFAVVALPLRWPVLIMFLYFFQARAPNCSVIIVGTFLDEADKKKRGYVDEMNKQIRKRFVSIQKGGGVHNLTERGLPRVVEIIEVSCKNNRNINKLRELIYDTVMELKSEVNNSKSCSAMTSCYHPWTICERYRLGTRWTCIAIYRQVPNQNVWGESRLLDLY